MAARQIIPTWIPDAAKREIVEQLQALPLDSATHAALVRLATAPAMRTEVWDKLPRDPQGVEGDIIRCAVVALVIFPKLRPRPKNQKRSAWDRWAEHMREHPQGLSLETCACFAAELRDAIGSITIASWARHSAMDPTQAISFLDALVRCFRSMAGEAQELLAEFPPVARWDDPRAQERFFSEWMSNKLWEIYGQRYDPVVAALTAVAFDRPDISAESVRWRRRTDRRK